MNEPTASPTVLPVVRRRAATASAPAGPDAAAAADESKAAPQEAGPVDAEISPALAKLFEHGQNHHRIDAPAGTRPEHVHLDPSTSRSSVKVFAYGFPDLSRRIRQTGRNERPDP